MKLIVAGATGFVATEVIRQCLQSSSITSVVALARRPVFAPENLGPGADASKLKSVVVKDFGSYTDEEKTQLAGADACIWTLAITPTKSKNMEWEQVRQICHDYTMTGLKAIFEARNQESSGKPFRFLYMSGSAAERDQSKTPAMMPQYCLMRGKTESEVLAFAKEHKDAMEACVAKPGMINTPGVSMKGVFTTVASTVAGVPKILVTEIAAAMIDQVVNGFEKEPLTNDDLARIGQGVLKETST